MRSLSVCVCEADGVKITAAMCLFPSVLVCGVSVISTGWNSHFPTIHSLYVCMCIQYVCEDINVFPINV